MTGKAGNYSPHQNDIIPVQKVRREWIDSDGVRWGERPSHLRDDDGAYYIHIDDARELARRGEL